jgi:UDP-glucuronate 4-epimerase
MLESIEDAVGKKALINKMPMQPGDVNRTFADVSKASKTIGYNPRWHFEDGIRKFVEWYQSTVASESGKPSE